MAHASPNQPPPPCASDAAIALYRHHCSRLATPPCPGVLRGLAGLSTTLSARGDMAAFPLLALLRAGGAPHVRTLDLGGAPLGADTLDSLAALLRAQGAKKKSVDVRIERLLMRRARVRNAGAVKILGALGVCANSPLRVLGLRGNRINIAGGTAFASAIATGSKGGVGNLERIDLSNNNLDHAGVLAVESAAEMAAKESGRRVELVIDGNLLLVEVLNGVTHGFGVIGAIAGGSVLAYKASGVLPVYQTLSVMLFCASLCTMFLSSCLYHSFFRFPPFRDVLHTCDHCSIFVLIAGS
jgi:hypothetical protein